MRRQWRARAAAAIVFVTLAVPSLAAAEPVTLARVMAIAQESAPAVTVAQKRVRVAEASMATANKLLRYNPALQGSLVTDAPFDNEGDRTASIGLAQTVEIGGQQGLRRDVARAEISGAAADARRTRNDLAGDVVTGFYALDTARRQVAVERQIAAVYRTLALAARSLADRGAITRLDLGTIEIEAARVEAQAERDAGTVAALESELGGLIGRPGASLEPVTDEQPSLDVPSVEDVLARAMAARPELAGARARQASATANQTLIGRELWLTPTFGLAVRSERVVHGASGFRFGAGGVPNLLGVDNSFWTASLEVSLPLPIFEQRNTDAARAHAAHQVATAEERAFIALIDAEARAAVARATAAAKALAIQQKTKPTMEEMSTLYESAFSRGAVTASETLLGEERVLRARLNYLAVRGEFLRARAMVDRVAGVWGMR